MNATEDGVEPLSESPAIETNAPAYPSVHEVTYYQARCTKCGYICDDYGDFTAYGDPGSPIEEVTAAGWFARYVPTGRTTSTGYPETELSELLCEECQKCEVCRADRAYEVDDHLVCADHEGHEFEAAS